MDQSDVVREYWAIVDAYAAVRGISSDEAEQELQDANDPEPDAEA